MSETTKKLRHFPMDLARFICAPLLLLYRIRHLQLSGQPVRSRIRGGALVVSNHTCFADPFWLGTCFWYRRLFFLTAKEIMFHPIIESLLTHAGCIKIDRSISDITALRHCVQILKDGYLLAVFPQGGICSEGVIDQIKSGAVLMSVQADVPIIPMYTSRRKHFWSRQVVVSAEPFYWRDHCDKPFPSVSDLSAMSQLLLTKMEECRTTYEQICRPQRRP